MRGTSAGIFLMYRTLGDGIRLHAAALVLSVAAGVPEWWCIVAPRRGDDRVHRGGRRHRHHLDRHHPDVRVPRGRDRLPGRGDRSSLPDGVAGALAAAEAAGKLQVIDFSLDPAQPFTFWAGVIGGAFLTLATHGTDHYLVQRLLVAKSQRDAAIGLTLSGFLVMAQFVAVPVAGHAALGVLRGPSVRARRRGAADVRLRPSCRARWSASSSPRWWRRRCRRRSTRWPRRPCATSTCRTSGRTRPTPQQIRVGAVLHRRSGACCRWRWRWPRRDVDSALQDGLAALELRVGTDRGRVPARRAHADRRRRRGTMAGMIAGLAFSLSAGRLAPVLFGWPGRRVDVERGRGRDAHVRDRLGGQPRASPHPGDSVAAELRPRT